MNRRDTVKLLAVGAAFWLTPSDVRRAAEFAAKARSGGRGYEPKFFTPHEWETTRVLVDLVIPREHYESDLLVPLLELIRAENFRQQVTALGGYDTRDTGRILGEL